MAAADSDVVDDSVSVTSSATGVDMQGSTSTSKLMSVAEADDVDTQNNSGSVSQAPVSVSSMSSVAGLLSRRNMAPVTPTDASPSVVTLLDVRKFVFQTTARSDKRIMGGLTAHTFTSQTFISSFAVGLAVGSILAIIIKLLTEVGSRALPYRR